MLLNNKPYLEGEFGNWQQSQFNSYVIVAMKKRRR